MRIRGKSDIEPLDIEYYKCIANIAGDISRRVSNELTPTFIVDEAIAYFHDKEEYEICQLIKTFYEGNPTFFLEVSRAEWFGTMRTIKKK